MTKADFKGDQEALGRAKERMRGTAVYRQMQDGRVIVAKWPTKKKKPKK